MYTTIQIDWIITKEETDCTNDYFKCTVSWNTDVALWWAGAYSEQKRLEQQNKTNKGIKE